MADDPKRMTFETEGEAIAFKEGIEAAHEMLNENGGEPDFNIDMFVDDDRWTVEYGFVV